MREVNIVDYEAETFGLGEIPVDSTKIESEVEYMWRDGICQKKTGKVIFQEIMDRLM